MEVLRSIPQLEALRMEWNSLADDHGHALLRHEWFVSAAKALHEGRELAVVIRTNGSRLDAAAPLVRTSAAGIERLEFIGAYALHEPAGFLARDATAKHRLLDDVVRLQRPLVLQRLPAQDALALEGATRRRGVLVRRETGPCLGVDLQGDAGDRAARPSGRLRADLKRAWARAAEHGDVSIDVTSPVPADVDAALEAFMRIEASGWKRKAGSALAVNAATRAFFRSYCRLAAGNGILRVLTLRIGQAVAASQLAVEVYGRLWLLKIAYDEAMARCSPGFLLNAEALAYASRRGLRSYEFLGGAEAWEERWRPARRSCGLAVFYPWTVRGGMIASLDVAGAAWRRVRRERPQTSGAEA